MVFDVGGTTPRVVQPSSNSRLGAKHMLNEKSKLRELREVREARAAFLAEKERKHKRHEEAGDWQALVENLAGVWKERVADPLDSAIDGLLQAGGCFLPAMEGEAGSAAHWGAGDNSWCGARRHRGFSDGHKAHHLGEIPREHAVARRVDKVAAEALRETLDLEKQLYEREREEHKRLTRIRKRTNGIRAPGGAGGVGEAEGERGEPGEMVASFGSQGG